MEFNSKADHLNWLRSQEKLPDGFKIATYSIEFKAPETGKDYPMNLSLIVLDKPTKSFAGLFTKNALPGYPVLVGKKRMQEEFLSALIINNKVSNVYAPDGLYAAENVCKALAKRLNVPAEQIIPSSTGVIGWRLPEQEIITALPELVKKLDYSSVLPLAQAIMTTDLYPKIRRIALSKGSITAVAKGAGMVEPNLATMLVFILTDIQIKRESLQEMLKDAVSNSFNAISVDSDESTSDTVLLLSSEKVSGTEFEFYQGLKTVCHKLALDVLRNGEGVKHVVEVKVSSAPDQDIARGVGKSIINSPLVQTAICGNDPNVGRILMATGKYFSHKQKEFNLLGLQIKINDIVVFADNHFILDQKTEIQLSQYLKENALYETQPPDNNGRFKVPVRFPAHEKRVQINIDLGLGTKSFTVWGADRTHEYISENAFYRT